jgi:predicted O-linked N-acetylglucosamine transferase (SPINDLY family)
VRSERWDLAASAFDDLVTREPADASLRATLAAVLHKAGRVDEAIAHYWRLLEDDPANPVALFNLPKPLLERCDWDGVRRVRELLERVRLAAHPGADWRAMVDPFVGLALPLSRADQREVCAFHAARIVQSVGDARAEPTPRTRGGRLRIGYLSGDFRDHAIGHLSAGMYARHDRERVEVHAYSVGPDAEDEYRRRIRDGCDRFTSLHGLSDEAAARTIARDGVDILVDLQGYTRGDRMRILSYRPAPLQVHYLGFPGPLAAPFVDYLVCDRTIVPPEHAADYPERLAYIGPCYQMNDADQRIAPGRPSRADCGLPESGVVLCSFSQCYKFEPVMFAVWMRILARVPGSVLWLYARENAARERLRRAAASHGIAPERLVFAEMLPKERHLARLQLADLALDTLYYNGHTTASDTIWAGVPVITCAGETFAARVGASIAAAADLAALAVPTLQAYEELAVELASQPAALAALKDRTGRARSSCALFDTARTVRALENAYQRMWARHQMGLPPETFDAPG